MADHRKEIDSILSQLLSQGWTIRDGKHWIAYPPDKDQKIEFISKTPSSRRVITTIRVALKRRGATLK